MKKILLVISAAVTFFVVAKFLWVKSATNGQGSFETEKNEIIRRANYLTSKVNTSPRQLLDEMPSGIRKFYRKSSSMPLTAMNKYY